MNHVVLESKFTTDETGAVTGIAWPFGTPDRVGDVFEKGAFRSAPARLPMLFAHDQRDAVGVWDSITESERGLEVRGRLLVDAVPRAQEVRALLQAGAVRGLSIGFTTKAAKARPGGGRTITQVELAEISIVAVPAHPGARVTSVKEARMETTEAPETAESTEAPDVAEVIRKAVDPIRADVAKVTKFSERLDRIEARLNRPMVDAPAQDSERKAFFDYVRKGREHLDELTTKALRVADDVAGGYIVAPDSFVREILAATKEISPIRQLARVTPISTGGVRLPRRVSGPTAYWVDEIEERKATDITYGQVGITAFEGAAYIDVSQQLLEDNAFDLEEELRTAFAEEFGRLEGEAFVKGSGVKQPLGFLSDPAVLDLANGHATNLNPDSLVDLFYAVPEDVAANGTWGMNRRTMAVVRKMKDTAGQYIWEPSIGQGQPASILGRPVREIPDMPDVASGSRPVVFGDFRQAYRIVDRIAVSILRDPYTQATRGLVRFHFRRRVGGAVVKPEALRTLKMVVTL